jgi:hypothetical protein
MAQDCKASDGILVLFVLSKLSSWKSVALREEVSRNLWSGLRFSHQYTLSGLRGKRLTDKIASAAAAPSGVVLFP